MIVLLKDDATPAAVRAVAEKIRAMGLEPVPLDDVKGKAFEVLGDERSRVLALAHDEGVLEILTRRMPLEGGEPVWPHFALRVGILSVLLVAALLLLTAFLPPGLSDPAPKATSGPGHVEWYLRPAEGLFRFLHPLPHWVGGTIVLLFGFALLLLPWIDRGGESRRARLLSVGVKTVGLAVLVACLVAVVLVRS